MTVHSDLADVVQLLARQALEATTVEEIERYLTRIGQLMERSGYVR